MKKDIEWLKDRLESLRETDMRMRKLYEPNSVEHRHFNGRLAAIDEVSDFIDELDEPEVLSQEWIDKNVVHVRGFGDIFKAEDVEGVLVPKKEVLSQEWIDEHKYRYDNIEVVGIKDLQNLLVPKQELPVIPQWVADSIESKKKVGTRLNVAMSEFPEYKLEQELGIDEHECNELYARAWLDGYTIASEEEEPLYRALIKGHELIDTNKIYWNYSKFDNSVFISELCRPTNYFLSEMTKDEWNKIGINELNAEFIKLEELE